MCWVFSSQENTAAALIFPSSLIDGPLGWCVGSRDATCGEGQSPADTCTAIWICSPEVHEAPRKASNKLLLRLAAPAW